MAFINAFIKAQGYNSELEQYTMISEIERTAKSSVMIAMHKALGIKVVIKSVPSDLYHNNAASFGISEINA